MSEDTDTIRVLLASDSFLIGDGLAALLADVPDLEVVGRARDFDQLLTMTTELVPEVVILSIRTPVISTMDTIVIARRLRADNPTMGIVVISERANGFALELLRGGPSRIAFLLDEQLPSTATVIAAVRELKQGRTVLDPSIATYFSRPSGGDALDDLTPREIDVLEQIAHGLSNRAVADVLDISVKAVEKYVTIIFRKLGLLDHSLVDRRVNAALIFLRTQSNPFNPLLDPQHRDTYAEPHHRDPDVLAPEDADTLVSLPRTGPNRPH
jgi:DNA-binding NarL/FixJ family response regulator